MWPSDRFLGALTFGYPCISFISFNSCQFLFFFFLLSFHPRARRSVSGARGMIVQFSLLCHSDTLSCRALCSTTNTLSLTHSSMTRIRHSLPPTPSATPSRLLGPFSSPFWSPSLTGHFGSSVQTWEGCWSPQVEVLGGKGQHLVCLYVCAINISFFLHCPVS